MNCLSLFMHMKEGRFSFANCDIKNLLITRSNIYYTFSFADTSNYCRDFEIF